MPDTNPTVSQLQQQFQDAYVKLCEQYHLVHYVHLDYAPDGIHIKTDIVEYNQPAQPEVQLDVAPVVTPETPETT